MRTCLTVLLALALVAGCTGSGDGQGSAEQPGPAAVLTVNVEDAAQDVDIATLVAVEVEHGTLVSVSLTSADGAEVPVGESTATAWVAGARLEPGTAYTVSATAEGEDGDEVTETRTFTARSVAEDMEIFPSVAPLAGETVGVGMPVVVLFDHAVTDRAAFEQHMQVVSTPAQNGSWYWLSDTEARWRPEVYWQAGTSVQVQLDLNSVPAGNGYYGQESRVIDFTVGSANIYTVDIAAHTLSVERDGQHVETMPVSTGSPQHPTRNGTKIIMEKHEDKTMDSSTTGVDSAGPGGYRIDVKWAMRLTYSGEFIHAAPWSTGSHGSANVSHGCTGLGTDDAHRLFVSSRRGDVVVFVGGTRSLEPGNGWTDWNVPFAEYQQGSALHATP